MREYLVLVIFCFTFLQASAQQFDYLPKSSGQLIKRDYYSLSYIEKYEQAEWVAYYLNTEMMYKKVERKDSFREDPSIITGSATYADYTAFKDYDAGHLLPSRPMQFDCDAMSETFYMSNMSPQYYEFNRYKWAQLEKLVRNMVERNDELYVVTGPVLKEFIGAIGVQNIIPIPKYYYKVILKYDGVNSKGIGFILENKKHTADLETFAVSIDDVEVATGIDFFSSLDDSLENKIEANLDKTKWSFTNPNSDFGYNGETLKCINNISSQSNALTSERININTATLEELIILPGIGRTKAMAIISGRPYLFIDDLNKIRGIGKIKIRKLNSRLTID